MAIQTVGGIQNVLKNYDSKDWVKSADLETLSTESLKDIGNLSGSPTSENKSFSEMLVDSIGQVNGLQKEANLAIEKLATGKSKNLHETMLAVEHAEIAFKTMNQIRMKVIDAYKEVMRMQV